MKKKFRHIEFINQVYPLNRTLVSDDTDLTMKIIRDCIPGKFKDKYSILEVPSGKKCWTWKTPKKYIVNEAYLEDANGRRIIDFKNNALHLVSYSQPINATLHYNELKDHLFYSAERPDAIPWKFFYYKEDWGLCLSYNQFKELDSEAEYKVVIDVSFEDGSLKIGELFIKGKREKELLLITNVCHPYQVNDSISGVSAVLDLLHRIDDYKLQKSLRILFLPETIGSICYFSERESLKEIIDYGIFTEMLGHKNSLVLQRSFEGNTYIDKVTEYVLKTNSENYRTGAFRTLAGNDELVTNGPWLSIPTISLTRSEKAFECYPEYHTSDDNPEIIDEEKMDEAANVLTKVFKIYDSDYIPRRLFKGPVFLSGYNLWGIWGDIPYGKEYVDKIMYLMEGKLSVFQIALLVELDYETVLGIVNKFIEKGLVEKVEQ